MKKKCMSIILAGLVSLSAFAENFYNCSPVYEVYRDTCYYQIDRYSIIYRDVDAPCEKGTEITGTPYYWAQKDKNAPNYLSPYIDPYDIKIKGSDTFDDYVLGSIDEKKVKGRWLPVWYFEAVRQKNREIVAMAEPDRLVMDQDVLPVEVPWYEYEHYRTAAHMDITNTGFFFNTPLKTFSRYGFVFENLKRIDENTYIAKVYPSLYDGDRNVSWFPYLENFPSLKDGKPFTARFEINGKAMKIYDNNTNKILFDLIQVPFKWATNYYRFFIKENIVIESMIVPEEYANRKEEDMFRMDRSLKKGKLMLVKENLRLRADESISSELIVVMAKDSWVEILSIGKEETIDGITSNWVQVSPVRNSVDADGKKVHYTVGWCFGGYLE